MPGGGFVTTEIKLPKNWNELVAPLGYQPIENFYLKADFADDGTATKKGAKSKKQPTAAKQPKAPARPAKPLR